MAFPVNVELRERGQNVREDAYVRDEMLFWLSVRGAPVRKAKPLCLHSESEHLLELLNCRIRISVALVVQQLRHGSANDVDQPYEGDDPSEQSDIDEEARYNFQEPKIHCVHHLPGCDRIHT